jgi:hypothetical protein
LKYRIISIDGCHTKNATLSDLQNAVKILSDDGFIILDDYFNPDWPGVKAGVDVFLGDNNDYRVFYLADNKFFLCHIKNYDKYIELVEKYPNKAKHYESRCYIGQVWKQQT